MDPVLRLGTRLLGVPGRTDGTGLWCRAAVAAPAQAAPAAGCGPGRARKGPADQGLAPHTAGSDGLDPAQARHARRV